MGTWLYAMRDAVPTGVAQHDFFGAIASDQLSDVGPNRVGALRAAEQRARQTGQRVQVLRRYRNPHPEWGQTEAWRHVSTVWIGPKGGAHGVDR